MNKEIDFLFGKTVDPFMDYCFVGTTLCSLIN